MTTHDLRAAAERLFSLPDWENRVGPYRDIHDALCSLLNALGDRHDAPRLPLPKFGPSQFHLRMTPELYDRLKNTATERGKSMNELCVELLSAEHPADDETPIDSGWLQSIGGYYYDGAFRFQRHDGEFSIDRTGVAYFENETGRPERECFSLAKCETRGDVRQLMNVLGIPLRKDGD